MTSPVAFPVSRVASVVFNGAPFSKGTNATGDGEVVSAGLSATAKSDVSVLADASLVTLCIPGAGGRCPASLSFGGGLGRPVWAGGIGLTCFADEAAEVTGDVRSLVRICLPAGNKAALGTDWGTVTEL
jgi:hypothetical protein